MIRSSRGKDYDVYAAEFSTPRRQSVWYGTVQRVYKDGSDGPVIWGSDPTSYGTARTALAKAKQAWKQLKAAGRV